MQQLDFKSLQSAWDKMKVFKQAEFKSAVPGLQSLDKIALKRTDEDDRFLTVEFINLTSAMLNPLTDIPAFNKVVTSWLKRISPQTQIVPGGGDNLMVRISKGVRQPMAPVNLNKASSTQPKYESKQQRPLLNILSVRPLGENR